ncbi:MAG: DUF2911 domain-containing protein [Longimicrobiales bacterium]
MTKNRALARALLFLAVALAPTARAEAQNEPNVKPSQTGTVSQEVGSTKILITYDRPVARGRELFGSLVKWGETWTPGANWATTIDLSDPVTVDGQALAKGKYSIWSIPNEHEWTLIFSKKDRAFHRTYPAGEDALRVQVKPGTGEHMETLAYYFPVVGPDSVVVRIHWGTTIVPFTIKTTGGK